MRLFRDKSNLVFIIILLAYLWYTGYFIYRTSVVIGGERYFVLFDDAAISMRYAKNLAAGNGLVWNAGGERVEGYTNLLWVVYMAFFHLLPIPASKIGLAIQISGAIFLAGNLFFAKKIAEHLSSHNLLVTAIAVLFTAFCYPLNNWSLQGMEVGVLALVTTFAAWRTLLAMRAGRPIPGVFALLGAATLIRLDAAVVYLVILLAVLWFDAPNRRGNLLWGLALLVLFLGGQTVFRLWYYGMPLPNTYYLKMTGVPASYRIARGLFVLGQTLWQMNWAVIALPLTVLFFRRDHETLLLTALYAGQMAYSIYVGGDAWEHKGGANRYLATTISAFMILAAYGLWLIKDAIWQRIGGRAPGWLANAVLLTCAGLAVLSANEFLGQDFVKKLFLIKKPLFVEASEDYVKIALALDKITTPQTTVALVSAGNIPYFSNFIAIDLLGKSDPVIARTPMHIAGGYEDFRPGHNKWDYDYSIGVLQPDLVIQLWEADASVDALLVNKYVVIIVDGYEFTARRNSPNILWDQADEVRELEP
jgi:hypothetical protein